MDDERWKTLFHPFERGLIDAPGKGERWLFVGARAGFVRPDDFEADLTCVQRFRPAYLALERQGERVLAEVPEGEAFDGALVLLGRYREDNFRQLREAAMAVRPGGRVVVAGGKTDGVDPLRKLLRQSFDDLEHASKHHGVVFWFAAPESGLANMLPASAEPLALDGMRIPPVIFSSDGPDPASVLLARNFDGRLGGRVADFGAGWGYLGVEALRRCPEITGLDSYEADRLALDACRANLAPLAGERDLTFHWCDLLTEKPVDRYDRIVMNPPFHEGRAARPEIGIGFIGAASRALKPGGHLLMVANRNLPYEVALEANFRKVNLLAEEGGFKIVEAIR